VSQTKAVSKVAVITRTKNRTLLLERAIKSVMGQSYNNLLMVIVNDGGDSVHIEKLFEKHKKTINGRVQLINNRLSLGMEKAANVGLKNSDSEYIVVLDDDDTWHPDFLKETVRFLDSSNYQGVVTATDAVREIIKGNKVEFLSRERFLPKVKEINLYAMCGGNQFPTMSFLFRRKVLKEIGYYDENAPVLGDWDFNLRFLRKYDIPFIDKVLSYYHQRYEQSGDMGNSIVAAAGAHKSYNNYLLNKYLREDLEKGNLGIGFITNLSQKSTTARAEDLTFLNDLIRQATSETHNGINTLHERVNGIDERLKNIEANVLSLIGLRLRKYTIKAINRVKRS